MNFNSVVVDTNLIFSALIPKSSKIREILFDTNLTFYSPNYLISEVYKHKDIVALAIDLEIPFWTGDKKLKEGLEKKGYSNFFNR
ncbi:MAG TPA: hypothetical protein ENN90_15490 [Mariniphaga anaerophila]|uniref:PIN domain-containing protein n=1 Tax=Mariniphaga anaerophila TaxID=1484053 RepID=A0A831PKM7_9BACT|nr:hypothetical protein [Mariniphaga anaerophila]